ncbi:hypothetical protein FB451DRAFT_1481068 [Mycena latifolia]|nr:hypothetical protein FB451DRAFT_1481068 [Mycena latifolia]
MATSNTSPTSPSRKPTALALKPNSKSDWLGPALLAAKTITAGAECVPFPYVKGAFGVIVVLLETVEKAKKNRDDLKELCENSMEIMKIVRAQISSHGPAAAEKLKSVCEELESALQKIVDEIKKWQDAPRGLRSRFREMVKSSSITDQICEYQNKVRTLCSNLKLVAAIDTNFQVHKIHETLTTITLNLSVAQATQSVNNCPPPSRIFHGRQTTLTKMHQYFDEDLGKQHIYVLYGLGGSGKTQIALKFIDESASKSGFVSQMTFRADLNGLRFSDIFLIDASTPETIDTGLKSIASTKNIGSTTQDALTWLRSKKNEWLLFCDNADDPKIDLHSFFPRCKHGNVLITSRNPELRGYGSHSLVSDMEECDAVELLLHSAAQDITLENKDTATQIVKYTTWQISFDKLSQPAAMMLQLCSFLHHGGISEQIFKNASLYSFPTSGPSKQELQIPVEFLSHFLGPNGAWDSLCFWNVTNELQAYSLINFDAARNMFSIHPLVHTWSQNTLTNVEPYHSCMTALVGMSIDGISNDNIQLASLALLPHVDSLFKIGAQTNFTAQYGKTFLHAHKYKKAEELLVQAVQKQRKVLGDDHIAALDLMGRLGATYVMLGQYKLAEQLLILVLEKRRKHLGEDHPDTLVALADLASTYAGIGQYKEAAELQTVLVEKRRQIHGADHPSTLVVMTDLARTKNLLGQFKAAEEILIAVLDRRRKISGDDHPETLIVMNNLSVIYRCLGKFQRAEELQIVILEKRRKILGEDHPATLVSMNNLASTYCDLGSLKEAAKLQITVAEKRTEVLGEDHPETLTALNNLGGIYHQLGDFNAAVELQLEVLEKRKKCLGLGNFKAAVELQIEVLEKRRKILGNNHPETLRTMSDLAVTYHNMSQFKEAEELQTAALEKRRSILGEDHPDTLLSVNNLAMVYHSLERFPEAMELLMMALEKLRKLKGVDHPTTLLLVHNLALVYHSTGQLKDAEELQRAVLEKRRKVLGDVHPDTLCIMAHLAMTYHSLNHFKEAEELQRAGLEKQRNILGEAHPGTLLSMKNLALTYHSLGRIHEAEELQQKLRNILAHTVENAEEVQVM